MTKIGDGLLVLAMLIWLSAAVGPWWLGVLLFLAAWGINAWEANRWVAAFARLKEEK